MTGSRSVPVYAADAFAVWGGDVFDVENLVNHACATQ